jgi:hypothetical protein
MLHALSSHRGEAASSPLPVVLGHKTQLHAVNTVTCGKYSYMRYPAVVHAVQVNSYLSTPTYEILPVVCPNRTVA